MNKILCCGVEAQFYEDVKVSGGDVVKYGYQCSVCGNMAADNDKAEAEKEFLENAKPTPVKKETKIAPNKPQDKQPIKENRMNNNQGGNNLAIRKSELMAGNMAHLAEIASPIIAGDKGALERLIKNNIRYVENATALEKVWGTPEGQSSIMHETEEAMIMGIELGKMGDLVPFGSACQLIPSVEAYKFVLTNGNNSPFKDLGIECVHENDDHTEMVSRKEGFDFEIKKGSPRGVIIGVIVWAERKDGKAIGDFYDADRLMEKAVAHSTSYQYYLRDKEQFAAMKSEGKTGSENGRDFFIKTMFKKGGGSWDKKVFEDELKNPYDGPDKPEMLRKAAGKSFLAPYMKVRNSEAAMKEAQDHEDVRDSALGGFDRDTVDGEMETL